MTIEEDIRKRAKEYSQVYESYEYWGAAYNGYEDGATEQDPISRTDERKKCIEKAWNFFKSYIHDNSGGYERESVYNDFKQAMEE